MKKIKWRLIGLKVAKTILVYGTLGLVPLTNWIKARIVDLQAEIDREIENEEKNNQ